MIKIIFDGCPEPKPARLLCSGQASLPAYYVVVRRVWYSIQLNYEAILKMNAKVHFLQYS